MTVLCLFSMQGLGFVNRINPSLIPRLILKLLPRKQLMIRKRLRWYIVFQTTPDCSSGEMLSCISACLVLLQHLPSVFYVCILILWNKTWNCIVFSQSENVGNCILDFRTLYTSSSGYCHKYSSAVIKGIPASKNRKEAQIPVITLSVSSVTNQML